MVDKVIQISKEAGQIIREGFGKNFGVEYKTNSANLVTDIDKKSEQTIINFIKKEFPSHTHSNCGRNRQTPKYFRLYLGCRSA